MDFGTGLLFDMILDYYASWAVQQEDYPLNWEGAWKETNTEYVRVFV